MLNHLFPKKFKGWKQCLLDSSLSSGWLAHETNSAIQEKKYLYLDLKVVVKIMDVAVHLKNHYSLDRIVRFVHTYLLADSSISLSGRVCHLPFEQVGPVG